ncbi:MAG: hypothetical protein KHX03_06195 [Clostridium sp.]|nr:hypothetical protein [Clostridium sp.]
MANMDKALKNKLFELIDKFSESKILVVGDIILDEYLWGMANRLSPEAPVPVLEVKRKTYLLGGAANVANNIAAMGATAILAGVIGDDLYSSVVTDLLKKNKINTDNVLKDKTRPTTVKTRLIAQNNKHLARVDNESLEPVSNEVSKKIYDSVEKIIDEVDLIILSDYVISVLSAKLIKDIVKLANRHDKTVLMDPKGQDFSKYDGVDILVPNMEEALIATKSSKDKPIKKIATALRKIADKVIITQSANGVYYYDGADEINLEAFSTEVVDATGAGGSFVAMLGLGLAGSNFNFNEALPLANYAAAAAVKKVGTYAVKPVNLKELIKVAYNNSTVKK